MIASGKLCSRALGSACWSRTGKLRRTGYQIKKRPDTVGEPSTGLFQRPNITLFL